MQNTFATVYYLTIPLIGAGISFSMIPLVLRKDYRSTANRIFILLLLSIGLWGILTFCMRLSPNTEQAYFWHKLLFPFGTAIFMLYYHFTCAYTRSPNTKIIVSAYVFLAIVFILSLTGLITSHTSVESYGYAPHFHPTIYFISLGGSLYLVMGLMNFVRAFRSSTRYQEKTRLAYMIGAIIVLLLFAILDFFPSLPPIGIFGNILFGVITAIAVVKYHLLDIYLVIRKGLAYVLMSTIVAVPYVGIIILFNNLVGSDSFSMWGYPVLLVFLALLLQPLWQIVQRVVDRWFYRERYDFLKELEYFSQEAHDISDLEQLGSSLVRLVKRALQISNVYLLLRSETGDFSVTFSTGDSTAELALKRDSPLLRWLQVNRGLLHQQDLDVIPQLQSLSAKERNELRKIEAELFVPLRTNKDELVGILVLGKKLSHQLYSEEDKSLISTVASRVAIELENARLYTLETTMRQELEKQDAQKTEFLHSVAHELKTPLTAIISSSELMSTDGLTATPEMRERLIDNINRSAWLMDRRVGELLDLARIRIGNIQLRLEALEISELIDEVASQLSSLFKNKGQPLGLEIQNALPLVNADKERVQQVLLNLLSNANKYSPTGSKIEIRARQENNSVLIAVEDSAAAISEQDRDKIFDPYIRGGDEEERQRIPGLGLGLAICKKIVELHEGEIWVESEVGRGNIFSFSLPIWNGEQVKPDDSSTLSRIGG
jgi:signal transduction histidine kinase